MRLRGGKGGESAGARRRARPGVLVGATYLEKATGLAVRVIDSRRSPGGPAQEFVVEATDGSRPGERWLCRPSDLVEQADGEERVHARSEERPLGFSARTERLLEPADAVVCAGDVPGLREAGRARPASSRGRARPLAASDTLPGPAARRRRS